VLKREVDSNCGIDTINKMAHKKSNHRKVLILQEFPSDVMVFEPVKKMSIKKISKDLSKVMKDKNNSRKIIVFDDVSKFLNRKKK